MRDSGGSRCGERISRSKPRCRVVVEQAAMKIIRAGLRDHRHLADRAKLRRIICRINTVSPETTRRTGPEVRSESQLCRRSSSCRRCSNEIGLCGCPRSELSNQPRPAKRSVPVPIVPRWLASSGAYRAIGRCPACRRCARFLFQSLWWPTRPPLSPPPGRPRM